MTKLKTFLLLLLLLVICLSGCTHQAASQPAPSSYYLNPAKDLKKIGRTALVELTDNSSVNRVSPEVTESLFQEIQKKQMWGLTKIRQDDPVWRSLQLDMDLNYQLEDLSQIRKTLRCDAILVGTITGFEPYPHMALSLRLRLIDLADGQLLWALEQVWDTTDKTTRDRIENFYSPKRLIFSDKNLSGQLGSVSSIKFFKFVACEIAETLQPK
jgi:hypothetical protein